MNLYSIKIIAWTLSETLEVSCVINTINKAKITTRIYSHCNYMQPNEFEKAYEKSKNLVRQLQAKIWKRFGAFLF